MHLFWFSKNIYKRIKNERWKKLHQKTKLLKKCKGHKSTTSKDEERMVPWTSQLNVHEIYVPVCSNRDLMRVWTPNIFAQTIWNRWQRKFFVWRINNTHHI